jgi:hypothetical protein
MARAKRPPGTTVHTSTFEAFDSPVRFDLCLFAESFHDIALGPALAQAARYAGRGAVIFDYFRRAATGGGTRGTHAEFLAEVARQGAFRIARDAELTAAVLPTFFVLDHLKNAPFGPFLPAPGQPSARVRRSRPGSPNACSAAQWTVSSALRPARRPLPATSKTG